MSVSRKDFLKYAGGAVGAGVAAGIGYPLVIKGRYQSEQPVVPGNAAELGPNGQSVLILGGGLAGLQAGCELADRGFKVTILEKSAVPGGKLKVWKDNHFAKKYFPDGYHREHGMHAIWGFYKNLREFMGRHGYGIKRMDDRESFYTFINRENAYDYQHKTHVATWPHPFDRLQMLLQPGMFIPSKFNPTEPNPMMTSGNLRAMTKLWGFNWYDDNERKFLDTMSFYEWARKCGMDKQYLKHYFDGVAEMGYFMTSKEVSALAIANFIKLPSVPRDARVDHFQWPPDDTFLYPMVKRIESKGGRILYMTEASGIVMDDSGRIAGIQTNQNLPAGRRVRRCRACGELIIGDTKHDHCPFCGAHPEMFEDLTGETRAVGTFKADHYVVAMDIPGARKFIANTELPSQDYFRRIMDLSTATILCVNLLYENTDAWEERFPTRGSVNAADFFPTGFKVIGWTQNWSSFQIPHLRKKRVDLIEVQVSQWQQFSGSSFKDIARAVHEELKTVIPQLPEPSEFYINRWDNYSGYRPGDEVNRPGIQSPVDNLMFIGDWVYVPQQSVFMERTNVTAKMLTNHLLKKIGQKDGEIEILQSGTPDWMTKFAGKFTTVRI